MPHDQTMRADINRAIRKNGKKKGKAKRGQRAKKTIASNQGGASIGGGTSA